MSPAKHNTYSETRDRKRLGKRILKSIQHLLQAAVRAEADITNKPVDTLLKELDGVVDASLETRQLAANTAVDEDDAAEENQDVPMPDAPEEGETIVAHRGASQAVDAETDPDADADAEADVDDIDLVKTEPKPDADGDAMDVDAGPADADASIEVLRSKAPTEQPDYAGSASHTPPDSAQPPVAAQNPSHPESLPNGVPPPDAGSPPPSVDGYSQPAPPRHASSGPLTPPQSNGSLGRGPKEPGDVLSEGGLPWYLAKENDLEVQGTSVVQEVVPPPQQEAATTPPRMLSEELSEMDEETLKDLGIDVNDHTITASPVASEHAVPQSAKKGRREPGRFRKGVRTSARKR